MVSQWIPYMVGAYLLGSVPFGRIIGKRVARIDITQRGSGNIGATNVARELGIKWGLVTLALDTLKGLVPVVLFTFWVADATPGLGTGASAVGVSALLGHQFSLFQGFRGGKGVATALGVYLAISPVACAMALAVFLLSVYKWDFISLGSILAAGSMPVLLAVLGKGAPLVISALMMAALICFKHRENIQRLLKGNERKWRARTRQPKSSSSLSNSSSE